MHLALQPPPHSHSSSFFILGRPGASLAPCSFFLGLRLPFPGSSCCLVARLGDGGLLDQECVLIPAPAPPSLGGSDLNSPAQLSHRALGVSPQWTRSWATMGSEEGTDPTHGLHGTVGSAPALSPRTPLRLPPAGSCSTHRTPCCSPPDTKPAAHVRILAPLFSALNALPKHPYSVGPLPALCPCQLLLSDQPQLSHACSAL